MGQRPVLPEALAAQRLRALIRQEPRGVIIPNGPGPGTWRTMGSWLTVPPRTPCMRLRRGRPGAGQRWRGS